MFGLFKSDPLKQKKKKYEQLLAKAVHSQRNGDMASFAKLSQEADAILKEIEAEESKNS